MVERLGRCRWPERTCLAQLGKVWLTLDQYAVLGRLVSHRQRGNLDRIG